VPTFLISHDGIKKELINAYNRGVDVKIIVDANNTRTKAFKELRAANIPIKVENYAGKMHSKSLLADDEYIVVGSENFSYSGENKNDENLVIIKNSKLAILYRDFFNYLWARIPDKYLKKTIRPESTDSIGSCYDGIDNNFDGRIDNSDAGCKKNINKRRK
jgi:phosphatidylserine/phosphatidylglycerophosphate/cardiolipin synthase-like enzyme